MRHDLDYSVYHVIPWHLKSSVLLPLQSDIPYKSRKGGIVSSAFVFCMGEFSKSPEEVVGVS